jgi:hypothetical protein
MTYITGDIPVGAYDSTRLANMGIGHEFTFKTTTPRRSILGRKCWIEVVKLTKPREFYLAKTFIKLAAPVGEFYKNELVP